MQETNIKPERITKPIQLLGAWLAGLFSINSCFLFAAANMAIDSFESKALVIASILNVPIFLGAVFLLQTKFRPELQEDSYYSTYLSKKTNAIIKIDKHDAQYNEVIQKLEILETKILNSNESIDNNSIFSTLIVGVNRHLQDEFDIKNILYDNGFIKVKSFGPPDMIPKHRVITVSEYLPSAIVTKILEFAKEINLDGYSFYDPRAEESDEDILIGSYGNIEYQLL